MSPFILPLPHRWSHANATANTYWWVTCQDPPRPRAKSARHAAWERSQGRKSCRLAYVETEVITVRTGSAPAVVDLSDEVARFVAEGRRAAARVRAARHGRAGHHR